ncbi:MAG: hypothetical protein F4Y01_16620 [Gammaproteobacteria bacterium]|nr:hypothetical protein [Gammaproteobacteria bacterium]
MTEVTNRAALEREWALSCIRIAYRAGAIHALDDATYDDTKLEAYARGLFDTAPNGPKLPPGPTDDE